MLTTEPVKIKLSTCWSSFGARFITQSTCLLDTSHPYERDTCTLKEMFAFHHAVAMGWISSLHGLTFHDEPLLFHTIHRTAPYFHFLKLSWTRKMPRKTTSFFDKHLSSTPLSFPPQTPTKLLPSPFFNIQLPFQILIHITLKFFFQVVRPPKQSILHKQFFTIIFVK